MPNSPPPQSLSFLADIFMYFNSQWENLRKNGILSQRNVSTSPLLSKKSSTSTWQMVLQYTACTKPKSRYQCAIVCTHSFYGFLSNVNVTSTSFYNFLACLQILPKKGTSTTHIGPGLMHSESGKKLGSFGSLKCLGQRSKDPPLVFQSANVFCQKFCFKVGKNGILCSDFDQC